MQIKFAKMHGLGNDFVIVEKSEQVARLDLKTLAQKISDRHLGLGCDQFILYEMSGDECLMYIYNADGSEAWMCGNATRCLVKLIGKKDLNIRVVDRVLKCHLEDSGLTGVNMGAASFDADWMPHESALWEMAALYKLEPREILCLDLGNPHLVIFKSDLTYEDKELIGSAMQHSLLFPGGINVSFVKMDGATLNLKVWERGAGFTFACGSGACASFAAAKKLGFVDEAATVRFELGELHMSSSGNDIIMTGPATLVAEGEYQYEV
jgi:diaminopimelate epimerase